eukprot:TRINITY_DN4971_c0_g1_i1.p1 TRINITY_DN4971_c0_g1~~TRINITY_DN4971_c0_g1_i1.p1  ORF type:complete len:350 (+),score=76.08 TRINITY_DN4971_c0_g1_i1:2-1051(+)
MSSATLPRVLIDIGIALPVSHIVERICTPVYWPHFFSSNPMASEHVLVSPRPTNPSLEDIVGIVTYGNPILKDDFFSKFPNLKVVSNFGVGVDHIDSAAAAQRKIHVGNTPNVLNTSVAELALGLILAAARDLPNEHKHILETNQSGETYVIRKSFDELGMELDGKTLGIVGFGRIGKEIAKKGHFALNMKIAYHTRNQVPASEIEFLGDSIKYYAGLEELLSVSDVVVLIVPLTPQTTDLMGIEQFRAMKRHSILVNVARGKVVNTDALVEALRQKLIWKAALDVTDPEPLGPHHPLLCDDSINKRVIVASHIGSATKESRTAMAELALKNLEEGISGRPLVTEYTKF